MTQSNQNRGVSPLSPLSSPGGRHRIGEMATPLSVHPLVKENGDTPNTERKL